MSTIHQLATRVMADGAPGVVVDYEPAARAGEHSRHVVRLDDGTLISTEAELVLSMEKQPNTGTVVLEAPVLSREPVPDPEHLSTEPSGI